ncbi:MAG: MarR family winged helix-turn-helix transcriptional regulator [Pseudomonadota bacterium]
MISDTCICAAVRRAGRDVTSLYDTALAPSGLTVTMFRVLKSAHALEGASITRLARALDLERSTLGRNLRVLERAGFARLADGEDERARVIRITPQGQAALARGQKLWQQAQALMLEKLGQDAEVLLPMLQRLTHIAEGDKT